MPFQVLHDRLCAALRGARPRLVLEVFGPDSATELLTARLHLDKNGWPLGFFERVAGSMPALRRGTQGDFEERLPLE